MGRVHKKMSSLKLFPIVALLFLVVIVYTGLNVVGLESAGNSNLDNKSLTMISNLNSELDNFNSITNTDNLSVNQSTNEGQDPFALQFLENKQQKTGLKDIANSVAKAPDLIFLSFSDDLNEDELNVYLIFLTAIIVIILFVAGFNAIFGDGRVT